MIANSYVVVQEDSTSEQQDTEEIALPKVRDELLRRAEEDQKVRRQMTSNDMAANMKLAAELMKVDKANREWLAPLIDKHGWLGKSTVGEDGASAAWLLVQHADNNLKFQRKCLDLMSALGPNEVNVTNVAYLTDRVLLAEGKPQRYGTQFGMKNGKLEMRDCEDPETLNERRKAVELGTIEEYRAIIEKAYQGKPGNDKESDDKESDGK